MKKRISKILILTLMITMISSISFAEDSFDKSLNYDEVLDLAIEHSTELETMDARILIAERNFRSAEHQSDIVDTDGITSDEKYLENGKKRALYPSQRKRELEDFKEDKRDIKLQLEVDVINAYNDLNNKKESVLFYQKMLETSKKEYQNKQKEFELGRITKTNLLEYEILVDDSELQLATAKRDYKKALITINRLIGYPLETEINLEGNLNLEAGELDYNLIEIVQKAKEKGPEVRNAYNDYILKDLEWSVVRRYTRYKKPEGYDQIEDDVQTLKEAYEDAKITSAVNAWTDYLNLLTDKDNYEISKMDYELANKKYEIAKVKHDLGMITFLEYRKSLDDLRSAYRDMNNKKLTLYTNKMEFDYYLSTLEREYESVLVK